jgi:zinc/manganese transport system ATP-binding protein
MSTSPAVQLTGAGLRQGGRWLWSGLDLAVAPGEFVAVLGPNGAGKTSLLRVLLGLTALSAGTAEVAGRAVYSGSSGRTGWGWRSGRGGPAVGYIPQQRGFDPDLGARGRDLVTMGADGARYGRPWSGRDVRRRVDAALASVGADRYADAPVGRLSGGEQQRLRVAQALLADPAVLLCDEPLLSLDLSHQRGVVELIDARRRAAGTAVVFVTHEINPILPFVDRVLYLAGGRWACGPVADVMTSERLSALYGVPVDVLDIRGRIVVIGAAGEGDEGLAGLHEHHHVDNRTPSR